MANAECSRPEDGWDGRCGRLVRGSLALPKIVVFTPILAAEPINRIGDPSGKVLKGVSVNLGRVGGEEYPGGAVAMEAGDFRRFGADLKGGH